MKRRPRRADLFDQLEEGHEGQGGAHQAEQHDGRDDRPGRPVGRALPPATGAYTTATSGAVRRRPGRGSGGARDTGRPAADRWRSPPRPARPCRLRPDRRSRRRGRGAPSPRPARRRRPTSPRRSSRSRWPVRAARMTADQRHGGDQQPGQRAREPSLGVRQQPPGDGQFRPRCTPAAASTPGAADAAGPGGGPAAAGRGRRWPCGPRPRWPASGPGPPP